MPIFETENRSFFTSERSGSSQDIITWLRKNGTDVPWSSTRVTIQGNTQLLVAVWSFFVIANANDHYELMWASAEPSVTLMATDPIPSNGVLPALPGIPSVIMTVNQVQLEPRV